MYIYKASLGHPEPDPAASPCVQDAHFPAITTPQGHPRPAGPPQRPLQRPERSQRTFYFVFSDFVYSDGYFAFSDGEFTRGGTEVK